jgi:hypothetical protein
MTKLRLAVLSLLLLGSTYVGAGAPGIAFIDVANVFTVNQRINAALGVNVAPGASGTISSSGAHFERSRTVAMGEWTAVAYAAGNFTAPAGMTWTVDAADQITYSYSLVGKTMFLVVYLDSTTIVCGPCAAIVNIAIPGGFTSASKTQSSALMFDNGVARAAYNRVVAGGSVVEVGIDGSTLYTAAANNTFIRVFIMFEVS